MWLKFLLGFWLKWLLELAEIPIAGKMIAIWIL